MAIEEPEAHLHPHLQRLIFGRLLRDERATQTVIVTTHSPHITSVADPRGLVVFRGGADQGVDRLSRKVRQLAQLAEELDTYEVTLRSATEPFDTGSAAGRMMLQMLAVFAEFEHATIVDRVSAGIERRAKEGRWYAGRSPFGYLYSSEHRTLVPDPVKAPVVRRIFDLYTRRRLGTIAIARQLRDEDAPAPAAGWGHPAVHWIISNPTYTGKIRWRDKLFDGVHEPLVDELAFQRAQAILRERGEHISRRRGNASHFLLSGVVRCGSCGKAYVGMSARGNGGRYEYYACSGRQKHGPKACRNERLPRHKLEHAVLQQLASLYRDGDLVAEALAKAEEEAARTRPEIEQRLASIGAEITRAEQALERYYEAFEQGKLSPHAATSGSRGSRRASKTFAPRKPNSPSRPRTRPDTARRLPILPALPTNSNASSPKASLRRRKLSSAC
jgi:site-specific DNA recombinase